LVVKVGADVTGVTAGLNTLEKRTRSLKKQFGSVTDSTLTWQGALSVLAGATGLAFAAHKVFELGAAVEETASKFRTVFGPATQDAQRFLDDFAATAGLTTTRGRELLATTGAITQGLGFTQRASAGVSEQVVRMAADIASFNNTQGGAERVTQAIISALNGETEALKESAKVVVLQADVMAKAAEMTGKATGEITRQDKALATLALIAERAGVAMGDLGRTMDSPANRFRELVADVLTFRDTVAHALLPAMTRVLDELTTLAGSDGFTGLGETITENSRKIAAWAGFAIAAGKFAAQAFAAPLRIAFNLGQVIGELANALMSLAQRDFAGASAAASRMLGNFGDMRTVVDEIIESFTNMRVAAGEAFSTTDFAAAVVTALEQTNDVLTNVEVRGKEIAESFASNFASAFSDLVTRAKGFGEAFSAMAKGILSDLSRMLGRMLAVRALLAVFPGLGTGAGAFVPIPGLAHGGPAQAGRPYVVGEKGPELFVPKTSGQVVPNNQLSNATAPVVNITFPRPSSAVERALYEQWVEYFEQAKHNGAVRLA
jgi:hypothetical protein